MANSLQWIVPGFRCAGTPSVSSVDGGTSDSPLGISTSGQFQTGQGLWSDVVDRIICTVAFRLRTIGTVASLNFIAQIWTMTGNNLNAQLGANSTVVPGSDAWNFTDVSFSFASFILVSANTNVAFVCRRQDAGVDGSNFVKVGDSNSDLITGVEMTWDNTGTIQVVNSGHDAQIGIYFAS